MDFDCAVIGGGPAGLTAATYLGRFRRRTLLVDAGHSRAKAIPRTRNYPGFADGISGPDLLERLREQAARYGAEIINGTVTDLSQEHGGFVLSLDGHQVTAARVLMATGLKDVSPDMPGLREAVAHAAVRYCPVCDAYEATDKAVAVYGPLGSAESKARFMRTYSPNVTLLPVDQVEASARLRLAGAGIAVTPPPSDFRPRDEGIDVLLGDGKTAHFDVLYPALGCEVRSELASGLGARCNEVGCIEVDDKQHATVDGLYAAGDVVSDLHQLSVAAGHAGIAATAIHNSLPPNFRSSDN